MEKKRKKKASCLKKPYGKKTITCYSFLAKGVGEGNIILALSILTGVGGPGTQNFSMGDPFFRGRMSLGQFLWNPIPHVVFHWDPDSLLHQDTSLPRVSAVSGFVCSYSLRPNQRYFNYVGTVLPVLNKY